MAAESRERRLPVSGPSSGQMPALPAHVFRPVRARCWGCGIRGELRGWPAQLCGLAGIQATGWLSVRYEPASKSHE